MGVQLVSKLKTGTEGVLRTQYENNMWSEEGNNTRIGKTTQRYWFAS
jgi:hypothetical protein